MKAAKAKYEFLGQDLIRVKNLISLDPYGKQADKRKKEAADYETKVRMSVWVCEPLGT